MNQNSYIVDKANKNRIAEIQRLATQASLGWDKERRTLTWFGLEDGMSLVELGSGPGFITKKLLDMLPNSEITALDIDETLLKDAKAYLTSEKPEAVSRLQFVHASVTDTKLPENTFDFAYARLLYQHLPDPVSASLETYRILKPGGKLVIYDIDDEISGIISPETPAWNQLKKKFAQAQAAKGGNRYIGRQLWRILENAGFRNLDLEIIAFHSDNLGIEPFYPQIDINRLIPYQKAGIITDEEFEAVKKDLNNFLAADHPYILMIAFMICGEKPKA